MTARERLASARQSSNLADRPDKLTDVSVLAAAGMVATGEAVGMALLRLRDTMDASVWPFCIAAVVTRVRLQCRAQKPRPTEREQHVLAERILSAWVSPICPACAGRRYQTIPGTPHMSDNVCQTCAGAGNLSIDYGLRGPSRIVALDVKEWMDRNAHRAGQKTKAKLYG
jgi:hypothetical protein